MTYFFYFELVDASARRKGEKIMNETMQEITTPCIKNLKCPSCGGNDHEVLGLKGGLAKSVGVSLGFGALGNLVQGAMAEGDTSVQPVQYKCKGCKNKFVTGPLQADPEDVLDQPCTINLERVGSLVGAAVPQIVYWNGIKVGPVKNGKTLSFQTNNKYNTLFVTDHSGVAFKGNGTHRFVAQPGGVVNVKFKRGFVG